MQNFKWKTYISLPSSNNSIYISTEKKLNIHNRPPILIWKCNNQEGHHSKYKQEMTSYNVKMTDMVKCYVCLDVIVNGLVANHTLFLQSVTCMGFLGHGRFVPVNDIVQLIITHTGCSISAIALLISIIISRKLGLTNLISGNNRENMCVLQC